MLVILSTAPYGGAEISEVDRIGRKLRDRVGIMAMSLGGYYAPRIAAMRIFTPEEGGAQHCQRDYLTLACDVIADWLEEKLK